MLATVEEALIASKVSQNSKPYFEIIQQLQSSLFAKEN